MPGQAPVTRSHTYDPDPNTGLLIDETVEPEGDERSSCRSTTITTSSAR